MKFGLCAATPHRVLNDLTVRRALWIVAGWGSIVLSNSFSMSAHADEPSAPSVAPDLSHLDAFHAVQEANRKLLSGDADRALELYDQAAKHEPDAREVALGRGLGHYAKQEFDLAKNEFLKAAAGKNDGLGADAAYAAAACDHAAALASQGDPKPAVSKLENAMRGYRDVLSTHPEHPSARDADRKAATTWRELKRQLQEQQQKQQQNKDKGDKQDDQEKKEEEQQKQDSQKDSEKKDQDQKQDSQQKQDSEQKQDQQQQQSSQQSDPNKDEQQKQSSSEQQQKEQEPSESKQSEKEDEKEAQAMKEQKEDVSREQAERKLREMMQAVRQRKKDHRETKQPVQVMPVDKDW